jgi:3-dehydroquinate dehydratase type I
LNAIFEEHVKTSITDYIHIHGWDTFRDLESRILDEILSKYPTKALIDCGGGVVELKQNRLRLHAFKEHGIVVHIMREKEAVLKYLNDSTKYTSSLCETVVEAWDRWTVLFRECCSFGFMSLTVRPPPSPQGSFTTAEGSLALKPVEEDFFRLLKFIHGVDTNKVAPRPWTNRPHFLSLTFEDVMQAIPVLDKLSIGVDLWEIRADLLHSWDLTFLASQVAILRRHSNLPILFTLRTISQGGKYPDPTDEASDTALRNLLRYALRLGVEYLDLQFTLSKFFIGLAARKRNTSIIGSYNNFSRSFSWMSDETRHIHDKLVECGSDIVMIINNVANNSDDQKSLKQFISSVGMKSTSLIAANMLTQVIKFIKFLIFSVFDITISGKYIQSL